jgi:predicted DNA-binding helix-hairpin-helix protein
MKRVYYSGYVPVADDSRLPAIGTEVPMLRENRWYQTDWLLRFYEFSVEEILNTNHPNLDIDVDPKLGWALRNLNHFPINLNTAEPRILGRILGLKMYSVQKIIQARKFRRLKWGHLKKIGVAFDLTKYFMICDTKNYHHNDLQAAEIINFILKNSQGKFRNNYSSQLLLFN